jgi:integrase
MASVHRTKRSKYWYGSVFLPGRKQILRSTGQTDKAEALKVAMEWERVAKGNHPHSAEQARRVLADIVKMTLGEFKQTCTSREYVNRWVAAAKGTVADSTLQFYKSTLDSWVKWLGSRADRSIETVSKEDVVNWRDAEAKRVRSKTANHRLKAVRALFRAALAEGFVTTNPADGLKILRTPTKEKRARRPFSREEIQKVLATADPTWKLMTLAGLQTGQRLGDIARMDWAELDLSAGVWSVTTGKTGTQLRIPLSAELKSALLDRKKSAGQALKKGAVFPDLVAAMARANDKVGPLSNAFGDLLYKAGLRRYSPHDRVSKGGKKAKLVEAGGDRREQQELSFHSLRHTARTWLEEAGQPKAVIDALIGHEGDTGKIYTTVGEDSLRNAATVLSGTL